MEYREWLYVNIHSSRIRIKEGFRLLENSHKLLEAIKNNEKQLEEKGSFTYEAEEEKTRDIPLPNPYQRCGYCRTLCCQKCIWPDGQKLSQCTYFSDGRGCPICVGHCSRDAHLRTISVKEKYIVKETKEYKAKKELYELSKKGFSICEAALDEQIKKISELGKSILKDIQNIKNSLIELDKLYFYPNNFTNEEIFEQMIEYEETEKNTGYEDRINVFKMMKEQTKINQITKTEDITHLFPQFNNMLKELKNKNAEKGRYILF